MDAAGRLLWWLIAGSEGGMNRSRIIDTLLESPKNAKQISDQLQLDYKTVRHHVEVLEKNGMVTHHGEKYGRMYFVTTVFEQNLATFMEIKSKMTSRGREQEKSQDGEAGGEAVKAPAKDPGRAAGKEVRREKGKERAGESGSADAAAGREKVGEGGKKDE